MAYRAPLPINVSYYYAFSRLPQSRSSSSQDPYSEAANPAFVAASLVSSILEYRSLLLQGKIEPDTAGGQKLCMESYKWSVRVGQPETELNIVYQDVQRLSNTSEAIRLCH